MTIQKNRLQSAAASKKKSFLKHYVWEPFKAAIFIASCLLILEQGHWLEGLDIATFQLAVPQQFSEPGVVPEMFINNPGFLKVVTINDKLYETRFKQSSPLDRCELHDIFKKILENKPKVLAVDLDLSPSPKEIADGESQQYNVGEDKLYKLLKQNKDTEVVLITPSKVYSDDLIDRKVQWMEEMCEYEHIHFGLPYLYSVRGMVLKHLSDPKSFANQINQATNKSGKSDPSKRIICCNKDKQLNRFVSAKALSSESTELKKLNYKFIKYIERIHIADIDNTNKLKGAVVLLGGSYGSTDKYETPLGTFAGVFLHAASHYSVINPVKDIYNAFAYLVEIGVGIVLSNIFCCSFSWYWRKRSLLSIIFNLVFPLLPMYLLIYFADLFLRSSLWIHPAPLIVGIAIHALLDASKGEKHSNGQDKNKLFGIPEKKIKCFFYCGIIFTALFFVFFNINNK